MPDLRVGEAQAGETRRGVGLVAKAVPGLRGRRTVVSQAIGFNDEPNRGPVEVHPEAIDFALGLGQREPCLVDDPQEPPLELRVGEREGSPVEGVANSRDPGAAGEGVGGRSQRVGADETKPVGFVYRGLELSGRKAETSIRSVLSLAIPQSAAALPWLSTASVPQLKTAAIQRPCFVSWGRPTA